MDDIDERLNKTKLYYPRVSLLTENPQTLNQHVPLQERLTAGLDRSEALREQVQPACFAQYQCGCREASAARK
jgi:hypothetical protein